MELFGNGETDFQIYFFGSTFKPILKMLNNFKIPDSFLNLEDNDDYSSIFNTGDHEYKEYDHLSLDFLHEGLFFIQFQAYLSL